jgi:hypothetical protein
MLTPDSEGIESKIPSPGDGGANEAGHQSELVAPRASRTWSKVLPSLSSV